MYPPREDDGRWRSIWYEDGQRKQCESPDERLAAKLEKVQDEAGARYVQHDQAGR